MRLDQALSEFEPKGSTVFDCLFLDGFAPSKNETMWHPASLRRLSYLCKQGASFSTFTAASKVRRCLVHCGFSVTRQKGFGRKREMLAGTMQRNRHIAYKSKAPWFHYPGSNTRTSAPVVIIGGGVAGCASAFALAQLGIKSIIIEQSAKIGGTAGALNRCLYSPNLSADFNLASQFYWHAYHHIQQYLRVTPGIHHQQCGVFFIADTVSRQKYLSAAYNILRNFDKDFMWLSENQTEFHTGISICFSGLFTNHGGWLNAQQFCHQLTNHRDIALQTSTALINLRQNDGGWLIQTDAASIESRHVIICTGWAHRLIDTYNLCRLETVKGQTTSLAVGSQDFAPKTILNNGHYLIPQENNSDDMIVGASFEKSHGQTLQPTVTADIENLVAIKHINPALLKSIEKQIKTIRSCERSRSYSGLRLTTRDHLPLIGPVPDIQFYQDNYPQVIQSGRLKNCPDPQYLPGLFVNTAHGSRGITASILSGKLISALIAGGCSPLPGSLLKAVHPARFFVRDHK